MKKRTIKRLACFAVLLSLIVIPVFLMQMCSTPEVNTKVIGRLDVSEDTLIIPTYLVNPPNPMPRFYEGRTHQGVQRRIYPYPMNDNLTRVKEDRKYHIIYIENEFIKIGIMPGMGGRVFEAVDKTNGYNFFYRQHVIKPSLIGMIGYWISGSLAWGFPHHHGPNTVEPMDYKIEDNPDGSVTVWMSYTELRHRMRIYYGYTVYQNSSIIEMTIRPSNPTAYANSFLFWSVPAVHCDTNYQVIFPPSVEYVTYHHKRDMTTWPISDRRFNNFDYEGVDVSWWKNTGVPSSFFAWDPQEDFFGGYDHSKQAGTAWIGNHHICPGMKYWADGNNPAGEMINNGLTDEDGRYIELMAGAYTDNQPDYSWLQPYESKDVTMTWYPIRLLGGLVHANKDGALNMIVNDDGKISVRLNTTRPFTDAKVILTYDSNDIINESIDITPDNPYLKDIGIEETIDQKLLKCTLYNSSAEILLEYQPKDKSGEPMPEPLNPPPAPEDIETVEELYLNGLRLNQFYNASVDPYQYYFEALERDPGDYRVNTQIGILYSKRKMFEEAEKHLQTAVDRITMRYTRPKDSDALYYLGVVKRKLGKNEQAYDHFYDASWNSGWHTPAYHQLAELDCETGDFETALEHINRALTTDIHNTRAKNLKVVILRKLGMLDEAKELANSIIASDLLTYQPRYELYLINKQLNQKRKAETNHADLDRIMQDRTQSYLEFSTFYSNCGFYEEAIDILTRLVNKGDQFPMIYYYLGFFWSELDNKQKAMEYFTQAQNKPHTYCFPFRDESVDALQEALTYHPDDAMAYYYLGNIYYELQPEKAIKLWENSRSINNGFYIVQRNLALAAQEYQSDLGKALSLYQEAFANNSEDSRLMYEYDIVCSRAKIPPGERYERIFYNKRHISKQRSETFLRELELLVFLGEYDEVCNIVDSTEFVESEGSRTFRDLYQNAYILRSLREFNSGNNGEAVRDIKKALDFPIGRWGSERRAQMYYYLGSFYEKMGKRDSAVFNYKRAISELVDDTEYQYEKGLAYQQLGQDEEARDQFTALLQMANRSEDSEFFRSFEAGQAVDARQAQRHYIRGLAYLGLDHKSEANAQFSKALELNPAHLWAKYMKENQDSIHYVN